ncbi:hypothetical protein EVAR_8428_1 [Eumeta japonica]|uniref:Uncharacterized protein n=1 Tax=Eumeta variegata TaxID=151549 RepID=A0A4C1WD40_EUMVA|nr:hypothetical protein EVAR_8428_1 [Eumeta japonica]
MSRNCIKQHLKETAARRVGSRPSAALPTTSCARPPRHPRPPAKTTGVVTANAPPVGQIRRRRSGIGSRKMCTNTTIGRVPIHSEIDARAQTAGPTPKHPEVGAGRWPNFRFECVTGANASDNECRYRNNA